MHTYNFTMSNFNRGRHISPPPQVVNQFKANDCQNCGLWVSLTHFNFFPFKEELDSNALKNIELYFDFTT